MVKTSYRMYPLWAVSLGHCCRGSIFKTALIFFHQQNLKIMKKNMGNAECIIRFLLAAVFSYLYFAGIITGTFGIIPVVLGAIFVLTSHVSFYPLLVLIGLNTCPFKKR